MREDDWAELPYRSLVPMKTKNLLIAGRCLSADRQVQGQLRIMGGVDKMQLGAGKDAITAYMKRIEPYVKRGGFIPFCDHRCPPNVKEEDYLFYLDLKESMFGMK